MEAEFDNTLIIEKSPIADPIAKEKLRKSGLKLIRELSQLTQVKQTGSKQKKILLRGIAEVTSAVRKKKSGLVLLAYDVFPLDVMAHLPILCEQNGVPYIYACDKFALGAACRSSRPTSAVFIDKQSLHTDCAELFTKVAKKVISSNPYFEESLKTTFLGD